MNQVLVPRPAATLILVRDASAGMEVFMIRRTQAAAFMGGAHVFPGGGVDAGDASAELAAHCEGLDDAEASRLLGVERGGLAYWTAALRECFEEAGLLLAHDAEGSYADLNDAERLQVFAQWRESVRAGRATLADLCREHGLRLAAGRLAYYSHWITQPGRPRRYDTRFFLAEAPSAQTASHDNSETVDHLWIQPGEALARHQRGEIQLVFPTIKTLESIAGFDTAAALLAFARSPRKMPTMAPRTANSAEGKKLLVPGDYAYAEVGRLDPAGLGHASCEIVPGTVVQLSPKVRRITAPNPGFMTGPGTNTYLLGAGGDIAVIDPGPAIDAHVEAVLAAAGARLRWILVTHTHTDHSPAAALLKARTGAELMGMPPPPFERQDQSFRPDRFLADGERIDLAGCMLRVIHAPGHASNQLCYLLEEERLLFTGDHVMQGSTVVINPPDGDMRVYLDSLRRLQREDLAWFAPGHGFLMDKPQEALERLLIHRLTRENKVLNALRAAGEAALEQLLPAVYDDVSARLYPVASRSLLAHLIKLKDEGRLRESHGRWSLA
ncbi:MAG: MBL fold metallo-hydrolase [Burkholderiales bacterium]|jgi:glyoxylase-like metal-dependent hydrolase (beta-lactamase superfamily II)/8-oxo-dGTP pyrophosphatase MutT (NUDIX family)